MGAGADVCAGVGVEVGADAAVGGGVDVAADSAAVVGVAIGADSAAGAEVDVGVDIAAGVGVDVGADTAAGVGVDVGAEIAAGAEESSPAQAARISTIASEVGCGRLSLINNNYTRSNTGLRLRASPGRLSVATDNRPVCAPWADVIRFMLTNLALYETVRRRNLMAVTHRADATWEGDLSSGSGVVSATTSGAFSNLPVTWASRAVSADDRTSPEELVAAAHASCYAMALSAGLGQAGTPPKKLEVSATVAFGETEGGWRVLSSELTVRGEVPGSDDDAFQKAAEGAKDGCPISQALKGNVTLSVKATLAG